MESLGVAFTGADCVQDRMWLESASVARNHVCTVLCILCLRQGVALMSNLPAQALGELLGAPHAPWDSHKRR